MRPHVPFIRPSFPAAAALAEDLDAIVSANWYSNFGPVELRFREAVAEYLGALPEQIVTMNNATTGLMAALAAFLPRGDGSGAIAIASFTFAAGAQAILWHGYRPAWMDIDAETLQPSLSSFRELLNHDPGVKAILLTNTFGIGTVEIEEWESLAAELGIPMIVDSAAGFGSRYADGARLGLHGSCEVFSFHATKPFAIGEGGAVVCRDVENAARMREFTNFGFSPDLGATSIGLNGKLQELNAAIGLRQLRTFDQILTAQRATFDLYEKLLSGLPLRFPEGSRESSLCFASAVLDRPVATALLEALAEASVDARRYYSPALHRQPRFTEFLPAVGLEETEDISTRIISLPLLPDMTEEEVRLVSNVVGGALSP